MIEFPAGACGSRGEDRIAEIRGHQLRGRKKMHHLAHQIRKPNMEKNYGKMLQNTQNLDQVGYVLP